MSSDELPNAGDLRVLTARESLAVVSLLQTLACALKDEDAIKTTTAIGLFIQQRALSGGVSDEEWDALVDERVREVEDGYIGFGFRL